MTPEQKRLFDSLNKDSKEEVVKQKELSVDDRVLIVDSLNIFLRAFTVIRHLNPSGNHVGGLTGFLRTLSKVINLVRPTRVVLVFDGKGSSTNKRYLYPEYKANRGIRRVTSWDIFENQDEESEAITNQIVRLVDYLKCLPVDLLSVDKIEADDVIGYMATKFEGDVTIVSGDRDYLQLVSDKITVYSPTKDKFYTKNLVLKEYYCTPQNFLMQKVMNGDKGDNVPGVRGLGEKTISKLYPELAGEDVVTLDAVIEKAKSSEGKNFTNIRNFEYQLRINEKLMDLKNPNIPEDAIALIDSVIENPVKNFNTKEFLRMYEEDQLGGSISNPQNWVFTNFHDLSKYKKL
jgi:5'-3' exonuclease